MRRVLIALGVLSAIVVAMPGLVVVGFMFLIVPGVILALVPTLFVYLLVTVLIRTLLPRRLGTVGYVLAFGIALLVGWAVMQPFRSGEMARYEAALRPDVIPANPLVLTGDVRLHLAQRAVRGDTAPSCGPLCVMFLDIPDVRTVTVAKDGEDVAFRLLAATTHPQAGAFPSELDRLVRMLPHSARSGAIKERESRLKAYWALRLATDERLVTTPVQDRNADWTVRSIREGGSRGLRVRRIEVLDADGEVSFRKSLVRHEVPARVFHFGFDGGSSADGFAGAGFHIARQALKDGDTGVDGQAEQLLLLSVTTTRPALGAGLPQALRQAVREAVEDPAANSARLGLAPLWLSFFWFDVSEDDIPLIAAVLEDARIPGVVRPLKNAFTKQRVPAALAGAYATRLLMPHTEPDDRRRLAQWLASMRPGTFKEPLPEYLAIWNDQTLRQDAAPFLARVADQGGNKAVEELLRMLEWALDIPAWHSRRRPLQGIREGFQRVGSPALVAAPRIRELFLERPSPILNTRKDADQWRLALALMGVPFEELPHFDSQTPETIAAMRKRVERMKERYLRESMDGDGPEAI